MRVMIDTNVIVSAIYNSKSKPASVLRHICKKHELVLCDYIIAECKQEVTVWASLQQTPKRSQN